MEIFSLKINKKHVGRNVPFDRIYLASYDDVAAYDALFRYALVMPLTDDMRTLLTNYARPDSYVNRLFDRNDDEAAAQNVSEGEWSEFLAREWVVGIPILSKFANQAFPRYLTSRAWVNTRKHGPDKPNPFSEYTYLQTPEKKIRPVCAMCPRYLQQQEGQCSLGQRVCYETLPLGMKDYYSEGLNVPEATNNIKELEEARITDDARLHQDNP